MIRNVNIKHIFSKRHYELDQQLDILFIFSSKLKHLQLSYRYFNKILDDMDNILQRNDYDSNIPINEQNIMNIERCVLEILTHIYSIRDCLKNKILATNEESNVNGQLFRDFSALNKEHKTILENTLEKNSENKFIKKLASKMRDKLIHAGLHKTKFMHMKINPKYAENSEQIVIFSDYYNLIFELLEYKSLEHKDFDWLWKYYSDKHIFAMQKCTMQKYMQEYILGGDQLEELKLRKPSSYNKIINEQQQINYPPIVLSQQAYSEYLDQKILSITKEYDKLLSDKNYRLFRLKDYLIRKAEKQDLLPPQGKWFNLKLAIDDIYNLYYDYYTQLHKLIFEYLKNKIDELAELEKTIHKMGNYTFHEHNFRRKYDFILSG